MIHTTLGRYRILGELGRGAMGTVYRAHDPLIDREVAIKTLHPNLPRRGVAEVRERFLREAKSAGRLNHPNIVTIFDVGEQDGVAYMAMELLEGRSLQQFSASPRACRFRPSPIWSPRSPTRSIARSNWASCIATSSRRTSSSRPRATPSSPISASLMCRPRR